MAAIDHLQEFRAVRISLPMKGTHPLPLDCVAKVDAAPFLIAVFLPEQLPVDDLETEGESLISFEAEGKAHSFKAKIDAVLDADRLRLEAVREQVRDQQRQHFRIDVELSMRYRRIEKEGCLPQRLQATVNISGGGLWFPVKEELEPRERLNVEIFLPGSPPQRVFAVVEVIRMTGQADAVRGVAVKFADIEDEDQDEIIAFCFAEQRRQLRKRVRLTDQL